MLIPKIWIAGRLHSSEASAFGGMQQIFSGGFNPMMAVALAKARMAEEKEGARGEQTADVETHGLIRLVC